MEMIARLELFTFTWWRRFKSGREPLDDKERSGQSSLKCTPENDAAVHALLRDDPQLTLCTIAKKLSIGKDTVSLIIHENMDRRNVCSHFLFLTAKQRERRVMRCQDFIETANTNPNFLMMIVTVDES